MKHFLHCVAVGLMGLIAINLQTSSAVSADFRSIHFYHNGYAIILHGEIVPGDSARFKELALSELRQGHVLLDMRLYSPGGNVDEALSIGRQVRMLKLYTFGPVRDPQGRAICNYSDLDHFNLQTGHYGSDCTCESACSLIWMGGIGRDPSAVIGIHAPRYDEMMFRKYTPDQADEQYKEVVALLKDYFNELGDVPAWTLQKMLSSDSGHMHFLSSEEISEFYNYNAALEELVVARCGEVPQTGSVWENAGRRRWFDCDYPILEEAHSGAANKYLATYGN